MNDVMVIDGFQIPAYAQNQQVENDFGKLGGMPTISPFTTSSFSIKVADQEKIVEAPLPVIILGITPKGTANCRAYYKDAYVPGGDVQAPDCSSSDGIAPDEGDRRQSETCGSCPMAAYGSSVTGKGQACAQQKILYVVPANKLDSVVYQVRVAPTSLKGVAAYGARIVQAGLNPATVITSLGLTPETESGKTYPILKLDLAGFLEEADGSASIERSASAEITSMIVTPKALPAPQTQTQPQEQVQTQPQEQVQVQVQTQTQPQEQVQTQPNVELDSAGQPWSADLHSSGKTKLQDGTWRKKAAPRKTQANTQGQGQGQADTQVGGGTGGDNSLDAVLSEWG